VALICELIDTSLTNIYNNITLASLTHVCRIIINFEIFISENKIFLNIQYFPPQKKIFDFLKNFKISENNLISVQAAKIRGY
jgi:hypothetical protein